MIGRTISHYKILEKLGEGGMGVVYKAEDTKLKRTVALKFLPKELEAHEPERSRLLQEAQAASALNHPNVCTIYDIKEEEGQHFIVMEYLDGKTLRQMVPIQKIQDAITFAIQIGDALHEAHNHGIVHRDVKPENIMINSKNQVKVMDFGLAKLKGSMKLTRTSSTVGTVAYMSPEQIRGEEVDGRSDIFSLGIVFYEMLTGNSPFRGEHEAAMMYSIVNEKYAPIQSYLPDVSSELVHLLDRALEKEPGDRFQNVADMVIDLRRLKRNTSGLLYHQVPSIAANESILPVGVKLSRNVLWALFGITVIVGVIAFLVFAPKQSPKLNSNFSIRTLEVPFAELGYPALSRDGNWIAFAGREANKEWYMYYMNVAQGNPRKLTTEPIGELGGGFEDISPDGSEVVYARLLPGGHFATYIVSSNGGVGRKIVDPGGAGKWRPDGKVIGYILVGSALPDGLPSESGKREFWTVKSDGSENHLEFIDSMSYVYGSLSWAWSPDGKSIAWLRGYPDYDEILIHDLETGKERQLTSDKRRIDDLDWASNHQIFFSSSKMGNTNIWMIPENGGKALQVTKGGGPDRAARVSSDAKRLLYLEKKEITHVWSANVDGTNQKELTIDNQLLYFPQFSPDNNHISFVMGSADFLHGGDQIFLMQSDGTNRIQLTSADGRHYLPNWSHDGKYLTYSFVRIGEPADSSRVYLVETSGSGVPKLVSKGAVAWWLDADKFMVLAPSPIFRMYSAATLESIGESQDTTIQFPLKTGKHVLILDYRERHPGLWLKGTVERTTKQLLPPEYLGRAWPSASMRYLLYMKSNQEVWRMSLPDGKTERMPEILNGRNPVYGADFGMSLDEQKLIYLKERLDSRLMLIENLFE